MLKVLMISLNKEAYGSKGGDFIERHLAYADMGDCEIHVVSLIKHKQLLNEKSVSQSLFFYPISSVSEILLILKATIKVFRLVREKKISVIYTQDPFGTALIGWVTKILLRTPLIVGNHSSFIDNQNWIFERKYKFSIFNCLAKIILPLADHCRVINVAEGEIYKNKLGISSDKISVLNTPVNLDLFNKRISQANLNRFREANNLKKTDFVFLWVGRPTKVKRLTQLLIAFRRVIEICPNSKLLLVGDFSLDRENLLALEKKLKFPASSLLKFQKGVDIHELPMIYQACECYVHSSNYEGFGKVLVEAGMSGLPVISTNTAGAQDVVDVDGGSLLVPIDDIRSLVLAMVKMYKNQSQLSIIGESARRSMQSKFNQKKSTRRITDMWHQVAKSAEAKYQVNRNA